MVLGVSASGGGTAEVKKEAAGSKERRRSKWKKMEGAEVNITLGEEGGSINWTDDLDQEIPPWEKEDVKVPSWDDNAYWCYSSYGQHAGSAYRIQLRLRGAAQHPCPCDDLAKFPFHI